MLGAMIGDICGSVYERPRNNRKISCPQEIDLTHPPIRFDGDTGCHFTDDTVLTCAVAEAMLTDRDYQFQIYRWANRHPNAGYGGGFRKWFREPDPEPYNSFGNGSAMRVSAVGWLGKSLEEVLAEAKRSAEVTHNHPEGIKGAQAVAAAVFSARTGKSKEDIKRLIEEISGYNLNRTVSEIRPGYEFSSSCQGSVPEAIICFLESSDFRSAVQLAVSIGGDTDTIAAMTGSMAEAFYWDIPTEIADFAVGKISNEMRMLLRKFYAQAAHPKKDKNVLYRNGERFSVKKRYKVPDFLKGFIDDDTASQFDIRITKEEFDQLVALVNRLPMPHCCAGYYKNIVDIRQAEKFYKYVMLEWIDRKDYESARKTLTDYRVECADCPFNNNCFG